MGKFLVRSLLALIFMTSAGTAFAIDFGDDKSKWANDGECDDLRFEGPGMTTTELLEDDVLHDATDCVRAFNAGRIKLQRAGTQRASEIDFGDDSSDFANDGECDDSRFTGPGMTTTDLLDEDVRRDATDCRRAYVAERVTLR